MSPEHLAQVRSRTAFSKACTFIWRRDRWVQRRRRGETIDVHPAFLEGLRRWYPRGNPKRVAVDAAVCLRFDLDSTRRSGCFVLVDVRGDEVTVSKSCRPHNPRHDLREAFRGAVLHQIQRWSAPGCEVDHRNDGGFEALVRRFLEDHPKSAEDIVKKRDSRSPGPFRTFKEPTLSRWRAFHEREAELQTLGVEQHRAVTSKRRRLTCAPGP